MRESEGDILDRGVDDSVSESEHPLPTDRDTERIEDNNTINGAVLEESPQRQHHDDADGADGDDDADDDKDEDRVVAKNDPERAPPQDTPVAVEEDEAAATSKPEATPGDASASESAKEGGGEIPNAEEVQMTSSQEETTELQGEILFDASMANKGYTNEWWLQTSSTRKLVHSGSVARLVEPPRRGFGLGLLFAEQYVGRTLALFKHPDVIFVLRPPKDATEVRTLLNVPKDLADDIGEEGFYVAESVIELNTCKIRLSQLTTPTSLASFEMVEKLDDMKRRSCFELTTPSENILLSAVARPDEKGEISFTGSAAYLETSAWEMAIATALHAAHAPVYTTALHAAHETDIAAWKHTIIRGTLHSLVLSGNTDDLKKALEVALAPEEGDKEKRGKNRILDERDEFGLTPLMYACTRRLQDAVSILINNGTNCTVTTPRDLKALSHLCAECLDDTSLSTILSATNPERPDPNALDITGRTPMYLASVRGKTVHGGSEASALGRCLSALEAWGGQMFVPDPEERTPLIHPIASKSFEWKADEINALFSNINYFYPLKDETTFDGKVADNILSIGQQMHYPLHSALIALRRKIAEADDLYVFENLGSESPLVSTLNALLKHGIDVNERLDCVSIRDDDEVRDQLNEMVGFTPLQILAAAAVDADMLASSTETKDAQDSKDANSCRPISSAAIEGIMLCIIESAELLVSSGARIFAASPPTTRKKEEKAKASTMTPSKKLSKLSLGGRSSRSTSGVSNDSTSDRDVAPDAAGSVVIVSRLPLLVDRSALKIDENGAILALLGGKDKLIEARNAWLAEPSVRDSKTMELQVDVPKEEIRGDANSCSICWKTFGTVTNRRHTCRITKRFVCDECSSKRMYADGIDHRICDGQFLLAQIEGAKADEEEQVIYDQERQAHQEELKKEKAARLAGPSEPEKVDDAKAELFGGAFMKNMKSLITGEEDEEEEEEDKLQSVTTSLSATRDAFNERGEKLNSLAEKTAALSDASKDFAAMAKELKKQQQSRGLFW